jgi:lipopolysaccharide/colanic/teichoic acid biosynthesis glycosyltransferase
VTQVRVAPIGTPATRLAKEVGDRVLALALLVVLSPLLLVCSVAIKLDSPGPVLYRQRRVGKDREHFDMLKLRSMHEGADQRRHELADLNHASGALFKVRGDPRVTRVGRLIRRLSIDELPQLWNVLFGHMSIVGPRPLPTDADLEPTALRRLEVKPGMTGLWQVNGRSDLAWDEALRLDLHYIDNWSPVLDVQIVLKTVAVVLHGRGAY